MSVTNSSALTYSIRAATMALFGKQTSDMAMQYQACRWYEKGLESQRLESQQTGIQLANGRSVGESITGVKICAPILFSLFETLMTTSFAAWAQHMTAAGNMIELRGPENCQNGIIHHLFRSVRIGTVFIGIAFERPSVFASAEWCTIPFERHQKMPFDQLCDTLLQIPSALLSRNKMRSTKDRNDNDFEHARQIVEAKARDLIMQLSQYWNKCGETVRAGHEYSLYTEITDFQTDAKGWKMRETTPAFFQDTFQATNVALYDAGIILANVLMCETTASNSSTDFHKQKIAIHSESILSIVAYHENKGLNSGGTTSMIFPMKAVCRTTPSIHQRGRAQAALVRWGKNRGVDGICNII